MESQRVRPENPIAVLVALSRARGFFVYPRVFPRILHKYVADSATCVHTRFGARNSFPSTRGVALTKQYRRRKKSAPNRRPLNINGSSCELIQEPDHRSKAIAPALLHALMHYFLSRVSRGGPVKIGVQCTNGPVCGPTSLCH